MLASAKQGDDGEEVVPVVQTHAEEMEDLKRGFLDAASALEGATHRPSMLQSSSRQQ